MAFGFGDSDFFGNIFTKIGTQIIGKGIKAAFTKDNKGGGGQPIMPSFSDSSMGLYAPSPTGKAENIPVNDYEVTLAMWNKRLFGNNSYTDITIPRIQV